MNSIGFLRSGPINRYFGWSRFIYNGEIIPIFNDYGRFNDSGIMVIVAMAMVDDTMGIFLLYKLDDMQIRVIWCSWMHSLVNNNSLGIGNTDFSR